MLKRMFFVFLVLFFAACNAQATSTVHYMNTGIPSYVSYGDGPRHSVNNFGSNAIYSPAYQSRERARRIAAGHYARTRAARRCGGCGNNYYNNYGYERTSSVKTQNQRTISRLDKNYKTSSPKVRNINGITYYN